MPPTKGPDFPVIDFMADLPVKASAGICLVSDPRGIVDPVTNKRYGFLVEPTSASAFVLYRLDLESRSKELLAAPPAAAAGVYNTAIMAAEFVPLGTATEDVPCVYVIVALTAAPWNQLMVYNTRTGVWTVLLAIPGMAAALNTSIDICNCSGALGQYAILWVGIRNRYLYISGGNTGGGGVGNLGGAGGTFSNVDQYNIITNAHVLLTGAGGPRGAAAAEGSKLVWLPNYPDRLYSNRGGASAVLDYYHLPTDAWTPVVTKNAPVMGEGTEMVTLYEAPGYIAVRPGSQPNEIYAVEAGGLAFQTLTAIAGVDGTIHASNALIAWWMGGGFFLGVVPHNGSETQRIQIPMPL